MIYEVELSEQADNDLRGIFEYIAFELQSPENASGQLDRLEEQILSLDIMPERYRKYENEPWKSRGLRVLPVDNYVIFYIPDSNKKVVTILRVMYAGRDIENQLKFHTNTSRRTTFGATAITLASAILPGYRSGFSPSSPM